MYLADNLRILAVPFEDLPRPLVSPGTEICRLYGVTLISIVSPPPPCSSTLLLVV